MISVHSQNQEQKASLTAKQTARRTELSRLLTLVSTPWLLIHVSGCNPTHNWREVTLEGNRATIQFPGKPAKMNRPIQLQDLKLEMSMWGAKAADATYTLAHARLPAEQANHAARYLQAMREQMVRNIQGKETQSAPLMVSRIDPSGKKVGEVPAVRIQANGSVKNKPLQMQAAFVNDGPDLYQWMVIGESPPTVEVDQFIGSLRLRA